MMKRIILVCVFFLTAIPVFLSADQFLYTNQLKATSSGEWFKPKKSKTNNLFDLSLQISTMKLEGAGYLHYNLVPEFRYRCFGGGLNLELNIHTNFQVRTVEWNGFQALLSKIRYLRYGKADDQLYLIIKDLENFSLGNGSLLYRMNMTPEWPYRKKLGIYGKVQTDYAGLEFFGDNLLDPIPDLTGVRLFAEPMQYLPQIFPEWLPIHKTCFSLVAAADFDIYNPSPPETNLFAFSDETDSSTVAFYGLETEFPVLDTGIIEWILYTDISMMADGGYGYRFGTYMEFFDLLPLKLYYSFNGPQFQHQYFDLQYFKDRYSKKNTVMSRTSNMVEWEAGSGIRLIDDRLMWDFSVSGELNTETMPEIDMDFYLDPGSFNKIGIKTRWERGNLEELEDIYVARGLFTFAELGLDYYLSDSMIMSMWYKRSYRMDEYGSPRTSVSSQVLMTVHF